MGNNSSTSAHNHHIACQETYVNKELSKIKSSSSYNSNKYSDRQIQGALRQDYNGYRTKYSNDYVTSSDYNRMRGRSY
jgi:hypothetical protein